MREKKHLKAPIWRISAVTKSAPKRYSNALIIHFILVSVFLPTILSEYWNAYYQDFFAANIIALLICIQILAHWTMDLKKNLLTISLLTIFLILYNAASFYMYKTSTRTFFWKNDQFNVTIAFIFFIILLSTKNIQNIITERTIKWIIYSIIINNLIGLWFRARGYSHIQMMNFIYWKVLYDSSNDFFGWMYSDAGEYALALLLAMAFFIVYKEYFKNKWTYYISQILLLFCLFLTNSYTFLLSAVILFGCQLIDFIISKYNIPSKYVLLSFPITFMILGIIFYILFKNIATFHTKFLIWKGSWEMLLKDPFGLGTSFGPTTYYVEGVIQPLNQAHNVFLNHMLRHSLQVGILFTILFLIIILCSLLHRPTYQSIGIWIALLIPLNTNYSLQTVHLPFTLFMIYCIFFRPRNDAPNKAIAVDSKFLFEILDLDEERNSENV